MRLSDPKPLSSLARIAIAAVCVQAICTASAPSISSFGAAAATIASAAFMAVSAKIRVSNPLRACHDLTWRFGQSRQRRDDLWGLLAIDPRHPIYSHLEWLCLR